MKKILIFGAFLGFLSCAPACAAVRDGTTTNLRTKSTTPQQARTSTTILRSSADPARTGTTRNIAPRTRNVQTTRAGALRLNNTNKQTRVAVDTLRSTNARATKAVARSATERTNPIARVAESATTSMSDTRTGAAYNQCKNAYFQCMDQFCQLKNDDYRRCSCSDRVYDFESIRKNFTETNAKLTEFTENLDMVGMTAAQATALHTASDGENALMADTSASKALLNAIMKSIRGDDTTIVSGKLSNLNSINLSFDTSNAFGLTDTAQVIASYNGVELYNAVYPSCRAAVASDCTDAALQRAVTAYLMAIEQDCNTVQVALTNKQKELKSAVREGSAMLDLARIENRQKHNSDNIAICINNIENAILSEQVCGANYHKCLDNGEFIDVSTGAPITGVAHFYELGQLLKFDMGKDAVEQKLSQISSNQKFVKNFEAKTKKFAKDAMDKCTEIADTAWSEYLDKALLAIYYAQQSKVETIKNGCFDLVSACYQDKQTAITAAMASLINGDSELSLMPDKIVLTQQMCSDYIDSCNNMFQNEDGTPSDIIANYVTEQADRDRLDACRAIVQQCFDDFGGANYENFYYPGSGLFETTGVDNTDNAVKTALDWFTLYEYEYDTDTADGTQRRIKDATTGKPIYVSECAKQIAQISSCADLVEQAFGGLDKIVAQQSLLASYGMYSYNRPNGLNDVHAYGWANAEEDGTLILSENNNETEHRFGNRSLRPTGVATEIYNQIIDTLSNQCMNVDGKFIEPQFINHYKYGAHQSDNSNLCKLYPGTPVSYTTLEIRYGFPKGFCDTCGDNPQNYVCAHDDNPVINIPIYREDVCPKDYILNVDTHAWGICSCWENGGRRSMNGMYSKCLPVINVWHYDQTQTPYSWSKLGTRFEKCESIPSYVASIDNGTPQGVSIGEIGMIPMGYSGTSWVEGGVHAGRICDDSEHLLDYWCTATVNPEKNQVCPLDKQHVPYDPSDPYYDPSNPNALNPNSTCDAGDIPEGLPEGIKLYHQ